MKCDEVLKRLDDAVDGELPAAEAAAVREHVGSCLGCRRELVAVRELVRRAAELPPAIDPERDLWPGVERRLTAARHRGPGRRWLAAAASLLLLALLPLALRRGEAPPESEPAGSTFAALAELARFEDGAQLPHSDLLATIQSGYGELPSETAAIVEENMRIIDQAIGEIRSALAAAPDDRQLNLLLANRYRQEVQLLKRANQI